MRVIVILWSSLNIPFILEMGMRRLLGFVRLHPASQKVTNRAGVIQELHGLPGTYFVMYESFVSKLIFQQDSPVDYGFIARNDSAGFPVAMLSGDLTRTD
jgi:hypothetical protein